MYVPMLMYVMYRVCAVWKVQFIIAEFLLELNTILHSCVLSQCLYEIKLAMSKQDKRRSRRRSSILKLPPLDDDNPSERRSLKRRVSFAELRTVTTYDKEEVGTVHHNEKNKESAGIQYSPHSPALAAVRRYNSADTNASPTTTRRLERTQSIEILMSAEKQAERLHDTADNNDSMDLTDLDIDNAATDPFATVDKAAPAAATTALPFNVVSDPDDASMELTEPVILENKENASVVACAKSVLDQSDDTIDFLDSKPTASIPSSSVPLTRILENQNEVSALGRSVIQQTPRCDESDMQIDESVITSTEAIVPSCVAPNETVTLSRAAHVESDMQIDSSITSSRTRHIESDMQIDNSVITSTDTMLPANETVALSRRPQQHKPVTTNPVSDITMTLNTDTTVSLKAVQDETTSKGVFDISCGRLLVSGVSTLASTQYDISQTGIFDVTRHSNLESKENEVLTFLGNRTTVEPHSAAVDPHLLFVSDCDDMLGPAADRLAASRTLSSMENLQEIQVEFYSSLLAALKEQNAGMKPAVVEGIAEIAEVNPRLAHDIETLHVNAKEAAEYYSFRNDSLVDRMNAAKAEAEERWISMINAQLARLSVSYSEKLNDLKGIHAAVAEQEDKLADLPGLQKEYAAIEPRLLKLREMEGRRVDSFFHALTKYEKTQAEIAELSSKEADLEIELLETETSRHIARLEAQARDLMMPKVAQPVNVTRGKQRKYLIVQKLSEQKCVFQLWGECFSVTAERENDSVGISLRRKCYGYSEREKLLRANFLTSLLPSIESIIHKLFQRADSSSFRSSKSLNSVLDSVDAVVSTIVDFYENVIYDTLFLDYPDGVTICEDIITHKLFNTELSWQFRIVVFESGDALQVDLHPEKVSGLECDVDIQRVWKEARRENTGKHDALLKYMNHITSLYLDSVKSSKK